MSSSRELILARARAALAGEHEPAGELPIPRRYRNAGAGSASAAELRSQFAERVADYGGTVRAGPREQIAELLAAAAGAHGAKRLGVPAGSTWSIPGVELVADDPPLDVASLEALDGVVTACALAVAQTGTVVLDGGARSGRRALTLLPDLHICVVEESQLCERVPDAIAGLASAGLHARPLTFVSGPSATSDIGFERVEGVHGPRRLEIVLVW